VVDALCCTSPSSLVALLLLQVLQRSSHLRPLLRRPRHLRRWGLRHPGGESSAAAGNPAPDLRAPCSGCPRRTRGQAGGDRAPGHGGPVRGTLSSAPPSRASSASSTCGSVAREELLPLVLAGLRGGLLRTCPDRGAPALLRPPHRASGVGWGRRRERPFLWRRDEELRHSTKPHKPPRHGCRGSALLPPRGELGRSPPALLLSCPSSPPWWFGTARRVRGPAHTVHSVPRSIWRSSGRTRPFRRFCRPPLRGKDRQMTPLSATVSRCGPHRVPGADSHSSLLLPLSNRNTTTTARCLKSEHRERRRRDAAVTRKLLEEFQSYHREIIGAK
jgi:hypothetical protein